MNAPPFRELDIFDADLDRLGLIEASAGTGKTWTITGLYLRLLVEKGYKVEQILVVTYTKAATAELRERIRRRLAEALSSIETGKAVDEFCKRLLERLAEGRDQAIRRLRNAILNFDEASIFTIHGFCQRVLTESAFESGVEFTAELAPDESAIVQEIVDDFWRKETAGPPSLWIRFLADEGQTPDEWRRAVNSHLDKPYLQLVQVPSLAEDGRLESTLLNAFQQAQNIWLDERQEITEALHQAAVAKRLKNTSYRPDSLPGWFESFDGYFDQERPALTLPEKLNKLLPEELEKGAAKNQSPPAHPFFDALPALIEATRSLTEHFTLKRVDLQNRLIAECNLELPRRKSRLALMSYGDLLNRLADALKEGGHLADLLRVRYPAALIDEFQDTDPVQYRIFHSIYGDSGQPVFFVGDPKQAIYGFRGADVFSYLQARGQAKSHYTLAVNQRSSPGLIEAVNALFLRSFNPFLFEDIDFPKVKAAEKERPALEVEDDGGQALRFQFMEAQDKAMNKETANAIASQAAATEIVRLLNLAAEGKARLEHGKESKDNRPINGGDIAVLVPTHRQGAMIEAALAERGVPTVRQGQDNVFETQEAVELERVLLAVAEPRRETRVRSALATELAGFDAASLHALQENEAAWEKQLYDFSRYREAWLARGFMPMFRRWLEENGVSERLLRYHDGERRLTNLLHLAELLQVESRNKPGPDVLLGWFSRARRHPGASDEALLRLESDADRVKIVTIHTSKGLEYPIVFCPFLWDGALWRRDETAASFHDPKQDFRPVLNLGAPGYPEHYQLTSLEKFAEKLRLLYVALTRAKYRCYAAWGNVSGLETAALAWLLHGPAKADGDPMAAMAAAIMALDSSAIEAGLREFAKAHDGAIVVEESRIDDAVYCPPAIPKQQLEARVFSRGYLRPDWRMASFSALARGSHSEGPDYDPAEPSPIEPQPARSIFDFPRGTGPGRCLHAVFEEWDFTSTDRPGLERLAARKLKGHALDEGWAVTVADCVLAALAEDLDGRVLRLGTLKACDRLAELEFTYPLKNLEVEGLKRLLADRRLGLAEEFSRAAESLEFDKVNGFMKGFIDLAFHADGRFYLVDYKSNWLGPSARDYAPNRLTQAMARDHYYLQYLIYGLALHRYLGLRLPDYHYERHFGGVFYLFLRGIGQAPRCGIFQDRPSRDLIEALDSFLS